MSFQPLSSSMASENDSDACHLAAQLELETLTHEKIMFDYNVSDDETELNKIV